MVDLQDEPVGLITVTFPLEDYAQALAAAKSAHHIKKIQVIVCVRRHEGSGPARETPIATSPRARRAGRRDPGRDLDEGCWRTPGPARASALPPGWAASHPWASYAGLTTGWVPADPGPDVQIPTTDGLRAQHPGPARRASTQESAEPDLEPQRFAGGVRLAGLLSLAKRAALTRSGRSLLMIADRLVRASPPTT